MNKDILIKTVARLVSPPKGILAIDESLPTCNKRFENLGVPTTEEKRREYRGKNSLDNNLLPKCQPLILMSKNFHKIIC